MPIFTNFMPTLYRDDTKNIARIAKHCPENISSVVNVSCFFKLKYVTITTVSPTTVTTVTITTVTTVTIREVILKKSWTLSKSGLDHPTSFLTPLG